MVVLNQGSISQDIVLTLNEKKTLGNPSYTIAFTHVTTKEVIEIVLGIDLSNYPERFNKFNIDPSVIFLNKPTGQWLYKVTENISGVLVENGKMDLKGADFTFNGYQPVTTYKGYAG